MTPYSFHAVLAHLDRVGPQTGKQLRESLGMARRTIYGALKKLQAQGYIISRPSLRDARQTIFIPVVKVQ